MNKISFCLLYFIVFTSQHCFAQHTEHELPFPRTKGVKKVTEHYVSYTKNPPMMEVEPSDPTIYLFNKDGYVYEKDMFDGHHISNKTIYEYKNGLLIKETTYSTPNGPIALKPAGAKVSDTLALSTIKTWEYYKDNKVKAAHVYFGKPIALDNETFYAYNSQGELYSKYFKYYKIPGGFYHGNADDSSIYKRRGDSVYVSKFKDGKQTGNYVFYEKKTATRYEQYSASTDGKHFMKEVDVYDAKGRLIQEDNLSDYPTVQADGIVLRADRVVHQYGNNGRLVSRVFYAMGTKCWQHNFVYEE